MLMMEVSGDKLWVWGSSWLLTMSFKVAFLFRGGWIG
jgi:hypothetical protein